MVVKRKHEEMEKEEKVEAPAATTSRQMQGQGATKHSIDSDDEEQPKKIIKGGNFYCSWD